MIKMKLLLTFLLLSTVGLFLGNSVCQAEYIHPARKVYEHHLKLPEEAFLTPYDVVIMALDDLDQERYYDDIRDYIEWYFKRINKLDIYGMSGTIYDFTLHGNRDTVIKQYDSVDGYSGLFLYMLNEYDKKTGDHELIRKHWDTVCAIAYTIPYLQQPDGLTIAFTEYEQQYLMDNCEAYGGMNAFIEMGTRLGCSFDKKYYTEVRDNIKEGILGELYEDDREVFFWVNDPTEKSRKVQMKKFYPDAFAQLFPIYFSVVDKEQARQLYDTFLRYHPEENWVAEPIEQQVYCHLTKSKMEREIK